MTSLSNSNFNKTSKLTINQCKVMIQKYYDKIYYLKNLSAEGFSNVSSAEIDFNLNRLQADICEINANKIYLKRQLQKRKLKRLKISTAKIKIRENIIAKRTELHDKIDSNLAHLAEESVGQLQKQEYIEKINWKIKNLDYKIEKSINTQSIINGLMVLRTLRENQSTTILAGESNQDVYNLLSLQNQLKMHISILQTAKKLLEKSKIQPANESRYTADLCEKLFGDRDFQPNPLDRMSVSELIEARKYWDQFFVNDSDLDGSYIPNHWVGESAESD